MVLAPFASYGDGASLVAIIPAEEGALAVEAEESRLAPDRKYEVRRQKAKVRSHRTSNSSFSLHVIHPSRNARSFRLRDGWRSLWSALASIWRMRSLVTPKLWPTSSSVRSLPSS